MLVTIGFKPSLLSIWWFLRLFSMLSHKQKKLYSPVQLFFISIR